VANYRMMLSIWGSKMKKIIIYSITIVCLLLIYEWMSLRVENPLIVPGLSRIYNYTKEISGMIVFKNIGFTFIRTIYGFFLSITLALVLAILSQNEKLRVIINPLISIFRSLPTISIIIILLIWFKSQDAMILIGLLIVFPLLYEGFRHSFQSIDSKLREVSIIYHFSFLQKIKYLYFFHTIEYFLVNLKQTFGLAFKIMLMSEVIGQARIGIGAKINLARMNIEMEGVILWTVILLVLVLIVEAIIANLSRIILKWK
jgi:NitT/TauT family transport system permease protein